LEIQEIGSNLKENLINDFQPLQPVNEELPKEQIKNLEDERKNIISKLERIKSELSSQTNAKSDL
jgi:hypothetical protein